MDPFDPGFWDGRPAPSLSPQNLRAWRDAMALSAADAADYLGVEPSTWAAWERDGLDASDSLHWVVARTAWLFLAAHAGDAAASAWAAA